MDQQRLRELAGVESEEFDLYTRTHQEMEMLNEKYYGNKHGLEIDTETMPLEEIQKRMEAASRAMGIANKFKNPDLKKKHLSIVMSHMNTIRAALQTAIKDAEGEGWLDKESA